MTTYAHTATELENYKPIEAGFKYRKKCLHCKKVFFSAGAGRGLCDECRKRQNRKRVEEEAGKNEMD